MSKLARMAVQLALMSDLMLGPTPITHSGKRERVKTPLSKKQKQRRTKAKAAGQARKQNR